MLILVKVRIKILADFAKYIEIYKLGAPESTRRIAPTIYDSLSDVGEIRVYQRADFQSGSRVLKKVF